MGAKRPKKKTAEFRHGGTKETHQSPRPPPHDSILQTLISAIQSPEGLKPANLKRLYTLLVFLSFGEPSRHQHYECALSFPDWQFSKSGDKLKFKDIRDLSDVLFRELERRFNGFFSALCDISASQTNRQAILPANIWAAIEELTLILRCCMVVLILIAVNQTLLMEKGRVLLSALGRLISIQLSCGNEKSSITFKKLVSRECAYVTGDCTTSINEEFVASLCVLEPSDPCYAFLCTILEVFADELLVHKSVREYFMLIDSTSSRSNMLFTSCLGCGNIGSVLEVICAHFVLSVSDGQAFENFLNRLFWCSGEESRIPELSLPAVLSLLLNPVMHSAPKMFQAYLILLVSEAIGIWKPSENIRHEPSYMDCCLTAFERSVILYTRHMSSLHADSHPLGGNSSPVTSCLLDSSCQQTFECLLQPATRYKLNNLIAKSSNSWQSYLSNLSSRSSEMVAAYSAYVKESLFVFDERYNEEISSIITGILTRCSSDDDTASLVYKNGETSPQDIYLFASILKLMSCSILQAIWHVERLQLSGCLKSQEDVSSCKEYIAVMDMISCFERFSIHLPVQKYLCEMMQSSLERHKSRSMLLHFSGLLSLSYGSALVFLVKQCIFMVMALLNLLIIEEGHLNVLGSLFGSTSRSEPFLSESSNNIKLAVVVQKSSQAISSNIKKIQEMYLRTRSVACSHKRKQDNHAETSEYCTVVNGMDSTFSVVEDTQGTCNGEIFLKFVLGQQSQRHDIDDLADFIVCKQGKDYSRWLRDRQRYKLWKYKKTTTLRWKKKRMAWDQMKGK